MGLCASTYENSYKRKRKRSTMEFLSAEAHAAKLLSQIPGRLCTNGATRSCSLYTREGCKGINQDAMLAWESFSGPDESVFCGVFDGHGPSGHMVASKVRDCLPSLLLRTLSLEGSSAGVLHNHHYHDHIGRHSKIFDVNEAQKDGRTGDGKKSELDGDINKYLGWIKERFTTSFHKMDDHLKTHPKLTFMSSGSTAVAMLVQGKDLVVGSVGDSRAILARRRREDGCLIADQLTIDLKPDFPGERERILEHQGRVFAMQFEPHIVRMWPPDNDTQGLAMSRAFGDFCLKDYGLVATPQISHRKLTEDDEFIVLATDGVFPLVYSKVLHRFPSQF